MFIFRYFVQKVTPTKTLMSEKVVDYSTKYLQNTLYVQNLIILYTLIRGMPNIQNPSQAVLQILRFKIVPI